MVHTQRRQPARCCPPLELPTHARADAYVAMYAVDALRQLAAKLLERAELARFTHQGEALRPFAAVLRHSGGTAGGVGGLPAPRARAPNGPAATACAAWSAQHPALGGCEAALPLPPTSVDVLLAQKFASGGIQHQLGGVPLVGGGTQPSTSLVGPAPHRATHADSPAVRELAVACVAHAVSAHPHGLCSGWRSVLAALALAARDPSPTVMGQALDALQPVVEALYRPGGHSLLRWVGQGLRRGAWLAAPSAGRRSLPPGW